MWAHTAYCVSLSYLRHARESATGTYLECVGDDSTTITSAFNIAKLQQPDTLNAFNVSLPTCTLRGVLLFYASGVWRWHHVYIGLRTHSRLMQLSWQHERSYHGRHFHLLLLRQREVNSVNSVDFNGTFSGASIKKKITKVRRFEKAAKVGKTSEPSEVRNFVASLEMPKHGV